MTDNLERAKHNLSATAYAAALDEIERLRADFSDAVRGENDALVRTVRELEAERDAALAEIERLRKLLRWFSIELARTQMRPLLDLLKEAGD